MQYVLVSVGIIFIYFLPSIIAAKKNKSNKITIYTINFFFGWSLIGWIAALYLAMRKTIGRIPKI